MQYASKKPVVLCRVPKVFSVFKVFKGLDEHFARTNILSSRMFAYHLFLLSSRW